MLLKAVHDAVKVCINKLNLDIDKVCINNLNRNRLSMNIFVWLMKVEMVLVLLIRLGTKCNNSCHNR